MLGMSETAEQDWANEWIIDPANQSSYIHMAGNAYFYISACADFHVHNARMTISKTLGLAMDPGSFTQPS